MVFRCATFHARMVLHGGMVFDSYPSFPPKHRRTSPALDLFLHRVGMSDMGSMRLFYYRRPFYLLSSSPPIMSQQTVANVLEKHPPRVLLSPAKVSSRNCNRLSWRRYAKRPIAGASSPGASRTKRCTVRVYISTLFETSEIGYAYCDVIPAEPGFVK